MRTPSIHWPAVMSNYLSRITLQRGIFQMSSTIKNQGMIPSTHLSPTNCLMTIQKILMTRSSLSRPAQQVLPQVPKPHSNLLSSRTYPFNRCSNLRQSHLPCFNLHNHPHPFNRRSNLLCRHHPPFNLHKWWQVLRSLLTPFNFRMSREQTNNIMEADSSTTFIAAEATNVLNHLAPSADEESSL